MSGPHSTLALMSGVTFSGSSLSGSFAQAFAFASLGIPELGFGTSQATNPDLTITVLIHIAHSPLPGPAGEVQTIHLLTHSFIQSQLYFLFLIRVDLQYLVSFRCTALDSLL